MHLDGLLCSGKVLKELGVVEIINKTRVCSKLKAGSHMIAPIVSVASVVCKVRGDWSKQPF